MRSRENNRIVVAVVVAAKVVVVEVEVVVVVVEVVVEVVVVVVVVVEVVVVAEVVVVEHFDRHAFFQPAALKNLSHKDKKTVNFAKHNIHGLTYQPRYQERAYEHDEVDIVLLRLYSQFKTEKRTVVAYKGGHVEKDLLNKLNITCLDLETWGCPKYEQLKQTIVEPVASCGFHLNDNIHHCPMTECHAFWLWFQTYVK